MINKIKNKIISATKQMTKMGFNIGSEGNISCRYGHKIFITPSAINNLELTKSNISEVDNEGKVKNGIKPSSEIFMHLYIYKKYPEIHAIVHCHSNWATILSCFRTKIPSFHYMVAEFGGNDIKCAKYATFGTKELAKNIIQVIKNRNACLISNHGQLTVGEDIESAVHLSIALEKLSKQYYFCSLKKGFNILEDKEMKKIVKLFFNYKAKH
tara:strand:- start:253 stop:888 length:636 start_codon:yes stop_codon:yes gene_type:complete